MGVGVSEGAPGVCVGELDGLGVAVGLDTAGAPVTRAGLAAGGCFALAAGAAPGASALVDEAGRAKAIKTPHTNPNATLTMTKGAL